MSINPDDERSDGMQPPSIPTEVFCLHCQQEYSSYLIEWRIEMNHRGEPHGFWGCPIPGCDGRGFGMDIWPIDPDYVGEETGERMHDFDDDEDQMVGSPGIEFLEQCIIEEIMYPAEFVIEGDEPPSSGYPDISIAIGHESWIERTLTSSFDTSNDDPLHAHHNDDDVGEIPF